MSILIRIRCAVFAVALLFIANYLSVPIGAGAAEGNTPPEITPIEDIVYPEDTIFDSVIYRVNDAESDLQSMVVIAQSSNQGLVPDTNITVIRAGHSGLIKMVPVTNQFGTTVITVTVTDTDGASASTTFQYTVTSVNDAPTIDAIADMVIDENSMGVSIPLGGLSVGPINELQTLGINAYATPIGMLTNLQVNYSGGSTGTLTFETLGNSIGTAVITVILNDGAAVSQTATRIFSVQITQTNQPPTITAIADQVTALDTAKEVAFEVGDAETTDAQVLIVGASSSNPLLIPVQGIVFSGSGSSRTAQITPATGAFGTATITFTVMDPTGRKSSRSFLFTVRQSETSPLIATQPSSQTIQMGGPATFSVVPVGEGPFTYQWQQNGADLFGQTGSSMVLPEVSDTDAGNYIVVVTTASGSVTSVVATLRVLINPMIAGFGCLNGAAQFSFLSTDGLVYTTEYKNSINDTNWLPLETRTGNGEIMVVRDEGAKVMNRFYRIRVD